MTKVTGELISIDDSAYDGFKGMTIYGNTVQNLWVNPSGTQNGVTVTANADGSATVSGTSNADRMSVRTDPIYSLKPNTTYTISCANGAMGDSFYFMVNTTIDGSQQGSIGALKSKSSMTFTTPSSFDYVSFLFYVVTSGTTVSGTYRVMLNEGSTAEPWCPPGLNSVDELSIVTAGKNLLKFQDNLQPLTRNGITFTPNEDGTITVNGTATANDTDYYIVGVSWTGRADASLPANDLVFSTNGIAKIYGYDSNGARVLSAIVNNGQMKIAASKAQACAKMLVHLSYAAGAGESNKRVYVQLELGSTATDYEPPSITTTPIDLQGHTLNALPDGTRDELHIDGGGNVVLEKRTWSDVFDGTESWQDSIDRYGLNGALTYESDAGADDAVQRLIADKLSVIPVVGGNTGIRAYSGAPRWVDANIATMSGDLAGFKSWLGNNNTTLIYPLAEPQTIDLGTVNLPKLRKKPLLNNIFANGTADGTGFSLAPEIDFEYNQWSTYCDGFRTHGKHSYFDMGCCIAARDTGTPEKKSVTATVPYMSGYYDLSKLYGAIAFEARQLMYRFEFVEDSREKLQRKKSQFLEWLSQVHDEEIADDDIPGRHFIGSLSEWEFEEGEEGQSGSLEVTFNCQPFLEADEDTTKTCNAGSSTVTVHGQPVNAYAKTSSGTATIRIGGATQSVGTTEIRLSVQLQPGDNAVTVTGSPVVLRWKELTA